MNDGVGVAIGMVLFLAISANRRGRRPDVRPDDSPGDHRAMGAGAGFLTGAAVVGMVDGNNDRESDINPDGGGSDGGSSSGGSWGGGGGSSDGGSWGGGDGGGGDGGGGGGD